jgi:hypothetical protein
MAPTALCKFVNFPVLLTAVALFLTGCAHLPSADTSPVAQQWTQAGAASPTASPSAQAAPWQHQVFPGKRRNHYQYVWRQGRPAMAVSSQAGISAMRQAQSLPALSLGQIQFSWKVASLIADADLQQAAKEDSPVRLVLVFDGDRSLFSAKDAMLSELARVLTGEEMPYATLMYVWSNQLPVGTVVNNRRTDRIRKLVIQSGADGINRWQDYERDIRADYERVFGAAPGALKAVALMTDTDNTASEVKAWYGPVVFKPRP